MFLPFCEDAPLARLLDGKFKAVPRESARFKDVLAGKAVRYLLLMLSSPDL